MRVLHAGASGLVGGERDDFRPGERIAGALVESAIAAAPGVHVVPSQRLA